MKKIYVMKSGDAYKIGVSIEPETRLKNLKIGNPYLKLVYQSQELSNGYAVEALIHKKISSHKISNEWFTGIGKNEIVHIVDEIVSSKGNTKNKNIDKNANVNPTIIYLTSNGKHISIEEYANQIEKEIKDMQIENAEIEKFAYSLKGYYVPNVFTEAILTSIFKTNSITEIQEMLGVTISGNIYSLFPEDIESEIRRLERLSVLLINNYVNINEIIRIIRQGDVNAGNIKKPDIQDIRTLE